MALLPACLVLTCCLLASSFVAWADSTVDTPKLHIGESATAAEKGNVLLESTVKFLTSIYDGRPYLLARSAIAITVLKTKFYGAIK